MERYILIVRCVHFGPPFTCPENPEKDMSNSLSVILTASMRVGAKIMRMSCMTAPRLLSFIDATSN